MTTTTQTAAHPDAVNATARAFARLLRAGLTAGQMAEVLRRNALPEYRRACASHDFLDANVPMWEAFCEAVGREPDCGSDADARLLDAAWDAARAADFYPEV